MNESKLKSMFKTVYSFIKDSKFDKAIKVYKDIDSLYRSIPKKDRSDSIRKDLRVLYKELKLYLKINDAYALARGGNLQSLKSVMEEMKNIAYELSAEKDENYSADTLINYYNKHNKFFLNIYSYKSSTKQFVSVYEKVKNSLNEGNINLAILNLSQLIIIYNKIALFLGTDEKLQFYSKLKEVYRDVSINRTFALSRSLPRKVHGKEIKSHFIPKTKYHKSSGEKIEKPQSFKELHKEIKNEDYSRLVDFYESM